MDANQPPASQRRSMLTHAFSVENAGKPMIHAMTTFASKLSRADWQSRGKESLRPTWKSVLGRGLNALWMVTTFLSAEAGVQAAGPIITSQPVASQAILGGTVQLSAQVSSGSGTLSYQWFEGSTGDTAKPIAGGTRSSAVVTVSSKPTNYWLRITDGAGAVVSSQSVPVSPLGSLRFTQISKLKLAGAEISAFDPGSRLVFTTSNVGLQIVDLSDILKPVLVGTLDFTKPPYSLSSTDVTSVAVYGGTVAVAVPNAVKQNPGYVVLLTVEGKNLIPRKTIQVGVLPDHVCFTGDGKKVLTADEGEMLLDGTDPAKGSVSIIDLSAGLSSASAKTVTFDRFDARAAELKAKGVRIFQDPTKTDGSLMKPSFDFEPEYIAVSPDNRTALVTLQEANAVAVLDLTTAEFTDVVPLGEKDISDLFADFSDKDGTAGAFEAKLRKGNPVFGLYMPDGIASYQVGNETFYVIANEGDDRNDFLKALVAGGSYASLVTSGSFLTDETIRLNSASYTLDPTAFPNAASLKSDANLGRLSVSQVPGLRGDIDGDGDVDKILTYGGRSFSILDATGKIVYDSGDLIERAMAARGAPYFDDDRSDNKGPEPEGVSVGEISGRKYAFVGLERSYGVLAFDITNPRAAELVGFAVSSGTHSTLTTAAKTPAPSDVSPEGVAFVPAAQSPNGLDLLLVSNEVSNTLTVYSITPNVATQPASSTLSTGSAVTLSVGAVSDNPGLSFQWYEGTKGNTEKPVAGATGSTFTVQVGTGSSNFWVRVTDFQGRVYDSDAAALAGVPKVYDSSNRSVFAPNRGVWSEGGVSLGRTRFINLGLQGVGRIPAKSVDPLTGESIGSVSDLQVENFTNKGGGVWSGTFSFLPDRGYNSGAIYSNYAARLNRFAFSLTPYTGSAATTKQDQIAMQFLGSTRFTYERDGKSFYTTGLLATGVGTLLGEVVPVVAGTSTQSDGSVQGRLTVDAEGLALDNRPGKSGSGWISDEYGPSLYHFNSDKKIDGVLRVPSSVVPRLGSGTITFSLDANNGTGSGRRSNQGIEGIAQSPDGKRLFALMQSGLVQDSNPNSNDYRSTATRLMVYDISVSDAPTAPVAQYVIELPNLDRDGVLTNGSSVSNTAAQSAIVALSQTQILILSRDGNGRGSSRTPVFKSILLADLSNATNLGTDYDAPGASVAAQGVLKPGITPVSWTQAINLIGGLGDTASELAKFGFNLNAGPGDLNTMSEKWEALGLVSVQDPAFPNDFFLFVGNDNDFLTASGRYLDANNTLQNYDSGLENDTVVLAYRVRIGRLGEDSEALRIYSETSGSGSALRQGQGPATDLGQAESGGLVSTSFTLQNPGSPKTLSLELVGSDRAAFSIVGPTKWVLSTGSSATVSVQFRAFTEGPKAATLRVRDDAPSQIGLPSVYELPLTATVGRALFLESGSAASTQRYLVPLDNRWTTKAILTVGQEVPLTGGSVGQTYALVGIPDGMGAYENGDGTLTVLVSHELGSTQGVTHAHGAKGAFVSEWILRKSDLSVVSGSDLIRSVWAWDGASANFKETGAPVAFHRFCSSDLPATSAFYNPQTGLGTLTRLFLNGEEGGDGRALAHVATGPNKGKSYLLPNFVISGTAHLAAWENLLACPQAQDKTIVIGTNDGGTGDMLNTLGVYIGLKTREGNEVQRAGLVGGTLQFIRVGDIKSEISDAATRATAIQSGMRFSLGPNAGTVFSRPEDGAWNPQNPTEFYFVTTDRLDQKGLGVGDKNSVGRTRLWKLTFDDLQNPQKGGTIELVLEGGVGNDATMWDNLTVTGDGKLVLQEDPGDTPHSAKVWFYDPVTRVLSKVLSHDESKFGSAAQAATAPYSVDEESSGVIDISSMLSGNDKLGSRYFLMGVQAHKSDVSQFGNIGGGALGLVERGQLLIAHQLAADVGPSTKDTPYLLPTDPAFKTISVLSVGDQVPLTGGSIGTQYALAGIPDGMGAFDNGDGTVTLLVNHEIGSALGVIRAHGGKGAFISKWVLRKDDLKILSGSDLIQKVYGWNAGVQNFDPTASTINFERFCSGDLPAKSAFYNAKTGLGSEARIFLSGEEGGSSGYAVAHVASGVSAGNSYILGSFNLATNNSGISAVGGWENLVASPYEQDKTVVVGLNDGGTGVMNNTVAVYIGMKNQTGPTEPDKAGLRGGTLKFVNLDGISAEISDSTTRSTNILSGMRFTLTAGGGTKFSRPEDGAWNPLNPREFYFVTTDQLDQKGLGLGAQLGRTRLWRLTFDDIRDPELGGVIEMMVEGGSGNDATMWDNLTVNGEGKILLQEDPGNTSHLAKVWLFDPATRTLRKVLQHDPARFFGNLATPSNPFHQDEESSGVIEVTNLGIGKPQPGERVYLMAQQAHQADLSALASANIAGGTASLVERGQLVFVRHLSAMSGASVVEPDLVLSSKLGADLKAGLKRVELTVTNVGTGASDPAQEVGLEMTLNRGAIIKNATGTGWILTTGGSSVFAKRTGVLWPGEAYPVVTVQYVEEASSRYQSAIKASLKYGSGVSERNTANNVVSFTASAGGSTAASSSDSPYLVPLNNAWKTSALLTVGDRVPLTGGTAGQMYSMVGLPDGLGAFDNGNGTFTLLMTHELGSAQGAVRAHGAKGAFVSEWILRKSDGAVLSGGDLIRTVYPWDKAQQKSEAIGAKVAFNRFCSADMPAVTALYNPASGLGSKERILLSGEEGGANGYAVAHLATGASKGSSYILGKFNPSTNGSGGVDVGGWENLLANPYPQDKTWVIGTNDGGSGVMSNRVVVYIGRKTNRGTEVDKAGLTNGILRFVQVEGNPVEIVNEVTRTTEITSGLRFVLSESTGTRFSRPEDGAWNPLNPNEFYFVTTDQRNDAADKLGTQIGRCRLWRLKFDDVREPERGGTIDLLLEGGVGNDASMWDNLTVTSDGKLVLQEDPGDSLHNAKVWYYDPVTRVLSKVLAHDVSRFGDVGWEATAPFTKDEESSGVIEVSALLGANESLGERVYLMVQQAHTTDLTGLGNPTEAVERGQLLLVRQSAVEAGPSTAETPYLLPLDPMVKTTSVLTVGDSVSKTGSSTGETYRMVGIPDGLGAYDNGDGSFTLLMNHELGAEKGTVRAHGAKGAFISEWVIRKNNLKVVSGGDLIRRIYGWDRSLQRSDISPMTVPLALNRLCSADLPAPTAFFNASTGLGTRERILLNGEEGGLNGLALAHVATGVDKGSTYVLGKFNWDSNGSGIKAVGGWENLVASPYPQNRTVVIGTNDGGSQDGKEYTGIMYNSVVVYVGEKQSTGTDVDRAGLNNGVARLIWVKDMDVEVPEANASTRVTPISSGMRFELSASKSTRFSRPEDGAWNPMNPREFYFVTTDQRDDKGLGIGTQVGRTRLWKLTFDSIEKPELGGVIDLLLTGGEGNEATMWDNLAVTGDGRLILQEDPGNTVHNAKVWLFDPVSRSLTKLLQHDPARFGSSEAPAASPFSVDEESSGVIDVTDLGVGSPRPSERVYLMVAQAHYGETTELVEGGQLIAVRHLNGSALADLTVANELSGVSNDGARQYSVSVRNVGGAATDGSLVEVRQQMPAGLSVIGMEGSGWTVLAGTGRSVRAVRSDVLVAGGVYPPLKVSISVSAGAALELSTTTVVSGGGDQRPGNNEFSEKIVTDASYRILPLPGPVSESSGNVSIQVSRRLGSGTLAPASVTLVAVDGSAKQGVDYAGNTFTANFAAGGSLASVVIPILDRKGTPEGTRSFSVLLKQVPAGGLMEGGAVAVSIHDAASGTGSSSGGSLSFRQPTLNISPSLVAGSSVLSPVTIVVKREGAASGEAQVKVVSVADGSIPTGQARLSNGVHYTLPATGALVTFANGQTEASLSLPLRASVKAGAFALGLVEATGASLGSTSQMVVQVGGRDTVKPTLNVRFGNPSSTGVLVVSGTVLDSGSGASGVARVEIGVENLMDRGTVGVATLQTDGQFQREIQLQPGSNRIRMAAYDRAGNVALVTRAINFVDPAAAQRAGTYVGLLMPEGGTASGLVSQDTVGALTITVEPSNSVSGQLRLGAFALSIIGTVDAAGVVQFRSGSALSLDDNTDLERYLGSLSVQFAGGTLKAVLSDETGGELANGSLRRRLGAVNEGATQFPAQLHALAVSASSPSLEGDSEFPKGVGIGSAKVEGSGMVSVTGTLSDGTPFGASGSLSEEGSGKHQVVLYSTLYREQGALALELEVDKSPTMTADTDSRSVRGVWIRPEIRSARAYKQGWPQGLDLDVVGARFRPAAGSASLLSGLAPGEPNAKFVFQGGKLSETKVVPFTLGPSDAAVLGSKADANLRLSMSRENGLFSGWFTHSDGKRTSFKGIVLQKGANAKGVGFFLSVPGTGSAASTESGSVTLLPAGN